MADLLTSGVVALAVLLLISVTINLLSAAYWIYRLRVRGKKSGRESSDNQEQIYEDVDGGQSHCAPGLPLKRNESYGKINPKSIPLYTNTAL